MDRALDPVLTAWKIHVRLGQATSDAFPTIFWVTGHDRFEFMLLILGRLPDGTNNYTFAFYDDEEEALFRLSNLSGTSDAINTEAGAFTDVTIGHDNGDLVAAAGDTELFRIGIERAAVSGVPARDFLSHATEVWLGNFGNRGTTALYDWVEVSGTESGSAVAGRPAGADETGLARDALAGMKERRLDSKR